MSNYIPKTDGLTLLNYQVNRVKTMTKRMANNNKVYKDPLVTIPYKQAHDIIENNKLNKKTISDIKKLSLRLSSKLNNEYLNYSPTELRELSNTIISKLNNLK